MEVDIVCATWLIQDAWVPLNTRTQKLLYNKHDLIYNRRNNIFLIAQ